MLFLTNTPLIIFTYNTGNFSDDYQLLLFNLKNAISPFSQNIYDIIMPRTDWHFVPVWNFINLLITFIHPSPQFFHFVIVLIHIFTAYLVYKICKEIYDSKQISILAGILYSISYSIHAKALTWNCFHSHITNTFTGAIALLLLIKYYKVQKKYYLIGVLILLIMTILNSESGFVSLVIIGIYAIYNYLSKKISRAIILQTVTTIFLAFSVYGSSMIYFSGNLLPILLERANRNTNQQLTEKIIGMRKNTDEEKISNNNSLNLSEMRSTYAPRTLPVLALRAIDLSMKITNLSIIEDVAKSSFYDFLSGEEKISFKQKIRPVMKIGFIAAGIALVFVIPLLIFIGYHTLNRESYPFLLILICLYPVFIILFNRVDIANSLAIFSSIIMADLFISSRNKTKLFRYFGSGLLIVFIGLASLAIFDGFENTYFFKKSYRMKLSSIYDQINDQLRGYSDNAVVFVNEGSTLAHPVMNYENPTNWPDMSHYNAFIYKDEFMKTRLAKEYRDKSFNEFASAKELHDNIQWILVKNADNSNIRFFDDKYNKVIYVDEIDNVIKIL